MKNSIRNISVIFMAMIVLFSTLSFTIDMHYCGDRLVDLALFKEAKTCGMNLQSNKIATCSVTKKSCCSDKELTFEGQNELKHSVDKITMEQQVFVASFCFSYAILFQDTENETLNFTEYPPPLMVKDIYLLNETFLI